MKTAGVPVVSGPGVTGDGYYEPVVTDTEGNLVETTGERAGNRGAAERSFSISSGCISPEWAVLTYRDAQVVPFV